LTVAAAPGTLARVNPWLGALVVVLTLALSTGGGWLTTRLVLHLASRSSDAGRATSPANALASRGGTHPGSVGGGSVDAAVPRAPGAVTATTSPTAAPPGGGRATSPTAPPDTTSPARAGERGAGASTEADGEPADTTEPAATPASDGPEGPRALAVLRGGTWIGLLERLATTGALLLGEPTAVAVVVAVKGLGRYPELREYPAASERFVVGSLASLTWAAGVGFVGRWLLTR